MRTASHRSSNTLSGTALPLLALAACLPAPCSSQSELCWRCCPFRGDKIGTRRRWTNKGVRRRNCALPIPLGSVARRGTGRGRYPWSLLRGRSTPHGTDVAVGKTILARNSSLARKGLGSRGYGHCLPWRTDPRRTVGTTATKDSACTLPGSSGPLERSCTRWTACSSGTAQRGTCGTLPTQRKGRTGLEGSLCSLPALGQKTDHWDRFGTRN